jgi:hypothetical protein
VGVVAQAIQAPAPDAQAPDQAAPAPAPPNSPAPPKGKVLFSRDQDAPASETTQPDAAPLNGSAAGQVDALGVTDAERDALTFTAYDLDVHLTPASAGIAVRVGLRVRNDGATPLKRLAMDISSSLRWEAISSIGAGAIGAMAMKFAVQTLDTDADHTGQMHEAVVTLGEPLAPGATLALAALYSGAIPQSAERLLRIGAPPDEAMREDWDAIGVRQRDVVPGV